MNEAAPEPLFEYHELHTEGDVVFLRSNGHATHGSRLIDGADPYVVGDGRIVAQTIPFRPQVRQ